jgi:hypothetical protein
MACRSMCSRRSPSTSTFGDCGRDAYFNVPVTSLESVKTFGRGKRVRLMVDLYNALNGNPVLTRSIPLTTNDTYAPPPSISWGRPVGVPDPRLFKVGAQFDF